MTSPLLDPFTHSSLLIYRTLSEIGNPFISSENNSYFALKSGILNPYFNFFLIKEARPSVEQAFPFFADIPFEITFERKDSTLVDECKKAGLKHGEDTTGLILHMNEFISKEINEENILIECVESTRSFEKWCNITALGFKLSKEFIKEFFLPVLLSNTKNFKFLLCYHNGIPASAILLFLKPPYASIFSLATRSKFQALGIASFLLRETLAFAKERKVLQTTVQASAEGKSVYKKIGFQEVCELSTYLLV